MKPTNWKSTAELVGIAAIVGSLIFVGLQMQQDRQVALGQVNQSTLEAMVTLDSTMADHADIWVKAANNAELTEEETVILGRLLNMWRLRSFYESESIRKIDDANPNGPVYRFAILLHENPGARKMFVENVESDARYFSVLDEGERMLVFYRQVMNFLDQLEALEN